MNEKKKLFIITIVLVSIIFTLITMLIFYILSYMNILQYPSTIFHIFTISKEAKLFILILMNISFTIAIFLYYFINLYLSFINNKK